MQSRIRRGICHGSVSGVTAGCVALAGLLALAGPAAAQNEVKSATLDAVKKRGQFVCGIDTGIPGYAFQDSKGEWQGLDVAYCRAIADAVLGSPAKVKFIGTTSKVRFSVLQSGEIDVLIRDSEHTFIRNTQLGLDEPADNFYTGQTFMVTQEPRRRAHQGPERRHDLPADRHHAGNQHRRLQPRQQHQDQHAAVRQAGGGVRRRRCRALRRLHR